MKSTDFQEIYTTWYARSFAFTRGYVQDEMVAEDIVSESLVKLWRMMGEKEIEYPQSLLFTLLKNKALDHLRHESVRQAVEEELVDAYQRELNLRMATLEAYNPEDLFSTEISDIIRQTLDMLPEQTRLIFEMSRMDGLPVKEIAAQYNLTPKAVEYHITRALKALRKSLKDYLPFLPFLLP